MARNFIVYLRNKKMKLHSEKRKSNIKKISKRDISSIGVSKHVQVQG